MLEGGIKFAPIGVAHKDAQFIETRKFQVIEIARLYRMPLHKINELERSTYSNIEQQSIEYVTDCLLPWIRRWEAAITRDLLQDDEEYFVEFLVDGLLRGDLKTRYEAYALARQWGWKSVNEIRNTENDNDIGPAGDVYLEPLNMTPAGTEPPAKPGTEAPPEEPQQGAIVSPGAFRILVQDAAERIATAEARELEKRAAHAKANGARYRAWVGEFYRAQRDGYAAKTLRPLAAAWAAISGREPNLEELLDLLTGAGETAAAPAALADIGGWRAARVAQLAAMITERFNAAAVAAPVVL